MYPQITASPVIVEPVSDVPSTDEIEIRQGKTLDVRGKILLYVLLYVCHNLCVFRQSPLIENFNTPYSLLIHILPRFRLTSCRFIQI
jgi:hypothetical protein